MSRGQERSNFGFGRKDIYDSLRPNLGLNSRTVSSSYQDTVQRNIRQNIDIFSHSSNRNSGDAANMPIFLEDTQENILSRDFNTGHNSNIKPSNVRLHNIPVSAALEAIQIYGHVTQSPSYSPSTKDWNLDFHKNINNPSEKLPAFPTGVLKSNDSSMQTYSAEPSVKHTSDISSCQPLSDLNLNNVDEEDEYLYGDSNSLPEMPKSLKTDPDQSNVKIKTNPGWSDDEDFLGESSNISLSKLKYNQMKSSGIWSLQNKSIQSKLTQESEGNTNNSLSVNMASETFSVKPHHSPVGSAKFQNVSHLSNKIPEDNIKVIVPDKDSKAASTSGIKSKYHVAAEVLKKKIAEKSKLFSNKAADFVNSGPDDIKNTSMLEPFKPDIQENKLATNSNNPVKDSKELRVRKPGENVKKLPKAFLQKHVSDVEHNNRRKRAHSREKFESIKHSKHNRDLSPDRNHSPSRRRSPEDEYKHRPPYHSRHRSPENDSRYYQIKRKSPHRDYDRHSYEYSTRHSEGHLHYSHNPGIRSRERSPRYHKYRARSPGLRRSRERSRSPGLHRSRERSRSPRYYRSRDYNREREPKKDSFKLKEGLYKSILEKSQSRKNSKPQDYSSGDSFCSLSFESESASSDNLEDFQCKKEKSSTKPVPKERIPEDTKSSKTDDSKEEKKGLEDITVENTDLPSLPDKLPQNLDDIFKSDKNSGDIELSSDFFDKEDKLINIVKMFENSQIISELVEGVKEHTTKLASPNPPLDVAHNTPNLLTPGPSVPNISFPNISNSQSYPIMPPVPVPVPFHPPPVNRLPPLTFPPPPVVPPPVLPVPIVPPPIPVSVPSTSMYGPFPVSIPPVDVCRIPDVKQIKKRPSTLRPINITMDISSNKSFHSSPVKSAEVKEKPASETTAAEQNDALIETFKKLKTERHFAHIKVNSCVDDMVEMRKMMDDTWGKKINASDRVFHSKCKNLLATASDSMSYCLKDAKRLDDELSRFKGRLPRQTVEELGNIKVEEPKIDSGTEFYSCFDSSNHTCYLCYKQFSNLLGILEHLQSAEHNEKMNSSDKEWLNNFKKPEQNEEGKKVVLKPVAGVEFMKPLTGYYCTLCSETLVDSTSAEQHLKSHEHFCQYKDYIVKHPLYERKCLFKKYIQHSVFSKDKKKMEIKQKEQKIMKTEEANERVKDIVKDQKSKEKVVDELEECDVDTVTSKNQSLPGIKLTLSGDKEKSNQNVIEKSSKASSTKAIQKVVFIGKAPNYKVRSKPWYKKDIFQKKDESSHSAESTLPTATLSKEVEKNSVQESSSVKKPDVSPKSSQNDLGIDKKLKTVKKKEKVTPKKKFESTCLTEEDSKKLRTDCSNANDLPDPCKEKNSNVSNDSSTCLTEGESKNLNTSFKDQINIPSTKKINTDSGDSEMSVKSKSSTKEPTSAVKEKPTPNQPESTVNEKNANTLPMTEDPTVNQALKNILLGTDSSMHQDIPLSEIKLPDISVQSSSKPPNNSMSHGESNIPVPMEIDDTCDKSVVNSRPKLTTEEDRDLYLLGIDKEDLIPLVVPVPPPSSLLNCASPSHSPSSSSPSHKPHSNVTHRSSNVTNKVNKNAKESNSPLSISTCVNKSSNSKEQTLASDSNLATTTCKTTELADSDSVDAKVCMKSQNVNIESGVDTADSTLDILQTNVTTLETTKITLLKTNNITECANQIVDASECNESLNKEIVSDKENLKKEPDTSLCLAKTVSQNEIIDQKASPTDCVILKSEQVSFDTISISECNPPDSCNLTENTNETNSKLIVTKDSDHEGFISGIKTQEICEDSSVSNQSELTSGLDSTVTQQSESQVSSEKNSPDMELCVSADETIAIENQPHGIKLIEDLVTGQSSSEDSSKEKVIEEEVCETVGHVEDQQSDIKPCQNLVMKQILHLESPKHNISDACISNDIMTDQQSSEDIIMTDQQSSEDIIMTDQQSSNDIKSNENSGPGKLLDQVSAKESTIGVESDMEVVLEQSLCQDSSMEIVLETNVCASISETVSEIDQSSSIKPNLNLACSTDQVLSMQSSDENISTETVDSKVTINDSKQQTVHTIETLSDKKEHEELITTSTYDSCKESISNKEISSSISESTDINMTVLDNNSSEGISASDSSPPSEQCLFENVCPAAAVRMEIVEQQSVSEEKESQPDVECDQKSNSLQLLNQDLVTESTSNITDSSTHQECLTLKKSCETELVNESCDNVTKCNLDLIPEKSGENACPETPDSDKKNLQSELVSGSMGRNEFEVTLSGVDAEISSDQCDTTSKNTSINTSSPDDLKPITVSVTEEPVLGQEAQQHGVMSEDSTNEKQEAGPVISSPGLEDKVGDPESKTQLLSSSSGDVVETQSVSKSDTDTDEYETEE